MNNKNIEEIIKEYMKEYPYTDVGVSCSALAGRIEEYYIKPNYTPNDKVQAEKEQYLDEFVKYLILQEYAWAKADIDCHFSFETTEDIEREVEQFKKESV